VAQLSTLGHLQHQVYMKRFVTIVLALSFVAIVFANTGIWQPSKKPTISLVEAVNLATAAVNKDGGDFYCLGGRVLDSAGQCSWDLDFCSTNRVERWVEVGADKTVIIHKDGPISHD